MSPGPKICLSFLALISLPLAGVTALAQEDPPPAAEDESAEAEPTIDLSLLQRAEDAFAEGKYEIALKLFEKVVAGAPPDSRVLLGLGRTQMSLGDSPSAVDSLLDASALKENDYDILMALADAFLLRGKQAAWATDYSSADMALLDARRMYEDAASLRPDQAAPWLGASQAERQRGDQGEALRLALKATETDPKHVDSMLELGSLRFANYWQILGMRGAEAAMDAKEICRRVYAGVLDLDPGNGFAMNGLAWIDMQAGDNDAAIEWFRKSLVSNPTIEDSYINLAQMLGGSASERKRLLKMLGEVVSAATRWSSGEERRHARAVALYYRGMAYAMMRDTAGLNRDLAEAARLQPSLAVPCQFQRARGLYRDNQYHEAAEILTDLVANDLDTLVATISSQQSSRDDVLIIRALADKMFRANDLGSARDLFRISAEVVVDSVDDWNNYAFFSRETRRFEESFAAYERALELDEDNASILNDTALILHYHLHRDLEYAAELYERAIAEGERVLNDSESNTAARQTARTAVRDATNNLRLLKAGVTKRGGGRGARGRRGRRDG